MAAQDTKSNQERIRELRAQMRGFGVHRAWIFGSRARHSNAPRSDWDILVEFEANPSFDDFMGLKSMLEDELKSPVDVLSRNACPPRFLRAIEADLIDVT